MTPAPPAPGMTSVQAPRSAARETVATPARKPSWTFASCPPSAASARPCSCASSTTSPLASVSSSSMAAVGPTGTTLNPCRSASEPAGSPKPDRPPFRVQRAPDCCLEERGQNPPDWDTDSAASLDP